MKNFTHLLFLLAFLVVAGSTNAYAQVEPQAGKFYTIRAVGSLKNYASFTYYLSAEEGTTIIKTTTALEYDERDNKYVAPEYIWYVGHDDSNPNAPYYLINQARGVMGRGEGEVYENGKPTGKYDTNAPIVSGEYTARFYIKNFPKTFSTSAATGSQVNGVNICFLNGDQTDVNNVRTLSVRNTDGVINWFDHSTKGQHLSGDANGVYWSTDFYFEEVQNYMPQEAPLTFTRTADDCAIEKEDGDPTETDYKHNVDYDYYATLNLSYPVVLPSDISDVYGIDANNPAVMSEYKVNTYSLKGSLPTTTVDGETRYVLPKMTPVLLKIDGGNGSNDGANQITRTLPEADRSFWNHTGITTGFHGTTSRTHFSNYNTDPQVSETYYVLGYVNQRVSFYYLSTQYIAANKAYFIYKNEEGNAANALNIVFNAGDATAIDKAPVAPVINGNAPIYDLTGRRVTAPVKGNLYIQGGRKFIQK